MIKKPRTRNIAEIRKTWYAGLTIEQKKQINEKMTEKRKTWYAGLTTEQKKALNEKKSKTMLSRTPEEKRFLSEKLSKAAKERVAKAKGTLTLAEITRRIKLRNAIKKWHAKLTKLAYNKTPT